MDIRNITQRAPPTSSAGMDHSEEMLAEVDEPPDELKSRSYWASPKLYQMPSNLRRESLLTQQLHSETEHTDDEHPPPPRTLSTQSTWSSHSAASTAELTSDDGHSVASPAISPPLPPTHPRDAIPINEKPLETKVKIVGQDHVAPAEKKDTSSEQSVEANLGRKRCITFACRDKQANKPATPPSSEPKPTEASPPKRKCMLKFVCPSRADADRKSSEQTQSKRPISPPPPQRRPSASSRHRGSDSTVTTASPKTVRKAVTSAPIEEKDTSQPTSPTSNRRFSVDSNEDSGTEATRFHEFATSEDEEEWCQESTVHRTRLTVDDTLKKEHVIRKTCEEVENEVLEEEEGDEEEDDLEDEVAGGDESDEDDEGLELEEEDESDEGFHSDDEGGFASSDDEDDGDSDFEWWKPSAGSTAATSVEHLDRLAIVNSQQAVPGSSIGSASSGHLSPRSSRTDVRKHKLTPVMPIQRRGSVDLPDSTDFVCGTLDEDRPLEQAYINRRKVKEAAKHNFRPQDIDPSFPTSDPEMDEEDNDDVDEAEDSEDDDGFMHGDLEELHGDAAATRRPSTRPRSRSNLHRSPPPPTKRLQSPPPSTRKLSHRSPPPPTRRSIARSPAPPRKLFGHSPSRGKSPAPVKRMTSPPNSPTECTAQLSTAPQGLAGRPQLTHTASLPRGGGLTISKLATIASDGEDSDTGVVTEVPKRGAIDIVKGLEKKRQRRKEKLYQKMCAKAAAKPEKPSKVKPGKGAERMREVGLQLQQYHGKAEHILSL